jgi:hypothetical protein
MTTEVPRVHDISDEEFRREFADRGRPVVISGCIDHWPARQKWSLDYFENRFGDKRVKFSDREWRIADFVQELRSGRQPAPYLNQVKFDEQFPELAADLGDLKYTRKNRLRWGPLPDSQRILRGIKAVFIGGAGSAFGKLHWDWSYLHVYISQVRGAKEFIIYAPEDSKFLYPKPDYPADTMIKDFTHFDIEQFPDVKKARQIRFMVEEGETAFIPAGWWHATKMHELSMSVAESALDRANWDQRWRWFADRYRNEGYAAWKVAGFRAYMSLLGRFS